MVDEAIGTAGAPLKVAERAATQEAVWLDENVFRAGRQGVDDVVSALRKVYDNREEFRQD